MLILIKYLIVHLLVLRPEQGQLNQIYEMPELKVFPAEQVHLDHLDHRYDSLRAHLNDKKSVNVLFLILQIIN